MVQTKSTETFEIPAAIDAAIREHRRALEHDRRMPRALRDALVACGAFRLFTPVEHGGHELPLAGALRTFEAFGRLDAAVAWNVWNGNMGFSAAMLPPDGVAEIWRAPDPVIVNSARPAGTASPAEHGYTLDGRWDIVSAVDAADWIVLFAMVPGPTPEVRACYVRHEQVEIVDTWHVHAMRGTGSNTFVARGVAVPRHLTVNPFAPARIDRPLYRIPAFTLASTGAAAIVVGVAQAAIDAIIELAPTKRGDDGRVLADRPHVQDDLGAADAALRGARLALLDAAGAIDAAATRSEPIGEPMRALLRGAMSHAAETARRVLATTYALASSSALYDGQAMERLFRDGNAAAQHAILHRTHLGTYGRVLLGRPAGVPVL